MARRKSAFIHVTKPSVPEGFRRGEDISHEELMYHQIAVSPEGNAKVFMGIMGERLWDSGMLNSLYIMGREPEIRKSYRFVRLDHGALRASGFLSDTSVYKILEDRFVRFPTGASSHYGVYYNGTWNLDETLTRQLFGVTFGELESFLDIFQGVVDTPIDPSWRHSRVTFSKSRDNSCDLSELWIPREFPFIAFGDTAYFSGHVSLHGFFRLMTFLCHFREHGDEIECWGFMKTLVDAGADPRTIKRMRDASFSGHGEAICNPKFWMELKK